MAHRRQAYPPAAGDSRIPVAPRRQWAVNPKRERRQLKRKRGWPRRRQRRVTRVGLAYAWRLRRRATGRKIPGSRIIRAGQALFRRPAPPIHAAPPKEGLRVPFSAAGVKSVDIAKASITMKRGGGCCASDVDQELSLGCSSPTARGALRRRRSLKRTACPT